ncbi:dihydrodipicolinate synthase family protein [Amycolatopsis jejuensis]|uniref:dihydrodipicolinate synthase family protein n=1 Tax=Amycolatopsis jejuensis TaxID=330084 RepID=UPI00068A08D8|nr:dihydrodipicolinate synthase family protein [Amycolatopsis jejuensis]
MSATDEWGGHAIGTGSGVVAFLPTPFQGDHLELSALERQVEYVASNRVSVALLGGLGEFYAVSAKETREMAERATATVNGRVPVFLGVGHATREAVEIARGARDAGVAGLVINPPYYVCPDPASMCEHVLRVTGESGLPVVIYSSSFCPMTDFHLERLVNVPLFRAIKDEVSSPIEFELRAERWGDRVSWWTVGELPAAEYIASGADIVTSAVANFAAGVSVRAVADMMATPGRSIIGSPLLDDWAALTESAADTQPSMLKHLLSLVRGFPTQVRGPSNSVSAEVREKLAQFVAKYEAELSE